MTFPIRLAAIASAASALVAAAHAAQLAAPAPNCEGETYRDFDFWVGDWEVFTPKGTKAGDNRISLEENGCLIVERWTSVTGGTGQSYNFVDLETGKWRQIWVSTAATIDYAGGLDKDGAMALEGAITYRNGGTAPFKGWWTPQADGTVRQYFEQYNAETKEWSAWFTGIYKRPETANDGE
ncbi:MAG: hypothetical protein AAGJ87_07765 [Pseudomonadota bacterium]